MIGRKPSFGNLKIDTNTKIVKKPNPIPLPSSIPKAPCPNNMTKSRAGIDYDV